MEQHKWRNRVAMGNFFLIKNGLVVKSSSFSMSDGALLVPPEGTNGHISGVKRDPN